MYCDIVFPRNNEKEFIELAERLGYSALVFVYEPAELKKIEAAASIKEGKLKLYTGIIAAHGQLRRLDKKAADLILVEGSEKNRAVLETKKTDIIFNLENQRKQDFLHQRNSGLNHILAAIASEKKTAIGFSFSSILSEKKRRARLVGRMMQNIMLCRKFKVKMVFASFAKSPYKLRAPYDILAFAKTIGMTAKEAKESLQNTVNIIKHSQKLKSGTYVGE